MSTETDLDDFLQKWRAAWPEWPLAQVFMPVSQRAAAEAWLALLQEWVEAAWGGEDPTPGFAKLAWWSEELRGWGKGLRRHPLGRVLQRMPAPWAETADALGLLQAVREDVRSGRFADAGERLMPFVVAVAACEAALFGPADGGGDLPGQALAPVALHLLWQPAGDDVQALAQSRRALLKAWPLRSGSSRASRIHAALLRDRLRAVATGRPHAPLPPWRVLWLAWRAARG